MQVDLDRLRIVAPQLHDALARHIGYKTGVREVADFSGINPPEIRLSLFDWAQRDEWTQKREKQKAQDEEFQKATRYCEESRKRHHYQQSSKHPSKSQRSRESPSTSSRPFGKKRQIYSVAPTREQDATALISTPANKAWKIRSETLTTLSSGWRTT